MTIRCINKTLAVLFLLFTISMPCSVNAEQQYWEYTFRPGDSIWKIADKYTTSVKNWHEIQRLNKIRQGPDRKIRPGTRIIIPVSMLKQQPTPARVIALSNVVNTESGTGEMILIRANGEKTTITQDTLVYSGDMIRTGKYLSLRLQFADLSELQILPDSEVVFDKLSHHKSTGMVDTRIRLNSGSVNTWVKKQRSDSHYEIKTPAAITAVRGTSFRLSSDEDQVSRTEVTGGTVTVSAANNERSVKKGYGIVAEKDKPLPEPVKLLDAPIIGENFSADHSELQVSWSTLDGAMSYRYQLASDENYNNIKKDSSTKSNTIYLTNLAPGHYYLRVRGVDKHKLEGVDDNKEFEIKPPAPPPPPPPPPIEDDSYWKIIMGIGLLVLLLV